MQVNAKFWPGSVNKSWGSGPVNTNRGPAPVYTNWGSGPGPSKRPGAGKYKDLILLIL